ncbi:MAG: carboxylesterase family protein [Myxococcales bacterium]|nr:carboxylesterase family protein [Myxococcales bacterium]
MLPTKRILAPLSFVTLLLGAVLFTTTGCPNPPVQPDGGSEVATESQVETSQETTSDASESTPEATTEPTPEVIAEIAPEQVESTPEAQPETSPETTPESTTCQPATPQQAGDISTEYGTVRGVQETDIWIYKGIPYAAPPVASLRWKEPQAPSCWSDIRPASNFGEVCPQVDARTGNQRGAENCLFLNIWRPAQATPQQTRPVMVFIHGGGNVQGSSSETITNTNRAIYDGSRFARQQDVVVVTFNYRLAALGYLALPELAQESSRKLSGNYGFLDQVFLLQWVQRNIQAFGGDPKQVMIFGESAGAVNTCTHLASPLSKGLFHAALMQSGACNLKEYSVAEATGKKLADQSDCKDATDRLACLRGKDVNDILKMFPGGIEITNLKFGGTDRDYAPVVDGYTLLKSPAKAIAAKEHNAVPTVIGSNADEYESLLSPAIPVPNAAAFEGYVKTLLPNATTTELSEVFKLYDVNNYAEPREALVDFLTDFAFTCPTRFNAKNLAQNQSEPVWRYFFSRRPKLANKEGRAAHGIELLYVFQSILNIPLFTPDPIDLKISNSMMFYWAQLTKTREPNGTNPPLKWTPYDATKDTTLQIDEPLQVIDGVRTDRCDLLEKIALP